MKPAEFQCAFCRGIFECGWSDEEAMKETKAYFGQSLTKEECVAVCDECFQKMHPANHPHEVETAMAEVVRNRK